MEFSLPMCKTILDTLPIGYYCKHRINLELSDSEETSFFSPMENKIVISYPIIKQGLDAIAENADYEKAVRSMLYHETSHAILTSNQLFEYYDNDTIRSVLNIFEDERIETILKDFYLNVDFKGLLYNITGGPKTPTNDLQKFFNLVRFRIGPEKLVKRVKEIISNFAEINCSTNTDSIYDYRREVIYLFDAVCKHNDTDFTPPTNGEQGEKENNESSFCPSDESKSNINANTDKKSEVEMQGKTQPTEDNEAPLSTEEVRNLVNSVMDNPFGLQSAEMVKAKDLIKSLEIMFSSFNKKNRKGNGVNTYSGIFNPRAVVRKDYRYFERSIQANGNNQFGTLHLNLFLDQSGSFWPNENITNAILLALTDFEKKNKNFSMDVYFINTNFHKCKNTRERKMSTNNGNTLPENINQIVAKAQLPNTFNYNIVLFDGDAFSDCYANLAECRRRFRAFDRPQTFLITESSNETYAKDFSSAKVIITNHYTDELITNLMKAFKMMLN